MSSSKFTVGSLVLAIAAVAVLVGGSVAQAEIISFTNPAPGEAGHFDWANDGELLRLEMTLAASAQPGLSGSASALAQQVDSSQNATVLTGSVWAQVGGLNDLFAIGVDYGESITAAGSWGHTAIGYHGALGGSELPEGVATYLPVAFDPFGAPGTSCTIGGADCHFGWIGVVRDGLELDAFAWGYETEVGVPIAAGVPEPGTLALLAVGAAGLIRRRRPA